MIAIVDTAAACRAGDLFVFRGGFFPGEPPLRLSRVIAPWPNDQYLSYGDGPTQEGAIIDYCVLGRVVFFVLAGSTNGVGVDPYGPA